MTQDLSSNDSVRGINSSKPIGATLLAILLLVSGLWIFWDRISQLVSIYSQGGEVVVHPAYWVNRTRDAVTATISIVAAVGVFRDRQWGWWMTVFNFYWRIVDQSILPLVATALTITFAGDKFVFHHDLVQALSAGVLFGIFLYYLMLRSVMAYFEVDCAERLQANAITFGLSFPIVTGFHLLELALQQHIEISLGDTAL